MFLERVRGHAHVIDMLAHTCGVGAEALRARGAAPAAMLGAVAEGMATMRRCLTPYWLRGRAACGDMGSTEGRRGDWEVGNDGVGAGHGRARSGMGSGRGTAREASPVARVLSEAVY